MMINKKPSILFCGMDEKTYLVLTKSRAFDVIAVNRLHDFETITSWNAIDHLFKQIYKRLLGKKKSALLSCLFFTLRWLYPLGSRLTRKYFAYLASLYKKKMHIIDFSDVQQTVAFIKKQQIDLMVVNNWWLLPNEIIMSPRAGTLNLHPSPLPKYRGSIPILWSLKNKDKETALTLMLLNDAMDGGDILKQYTIPITEEDDAISLEDKCNE